jgi:DNA repair protein RecN (Recombination protein N)
MGVLTELHIENLGRHRASHARARPGVTALTGETGAGKTMLVEAIELLVGGRADTSIVRPGAGSRRASTAGSRCSADGRVDEVVLTVSSPPTVARVPTSTGALPRSRTWPTWHADADRPPRPARPPEPAVGGHPTRRARRVRPVDLGPLRAARARSPRSTPSSRPSGATSGLGRARSTCCATRSASSTRPGSTTPTRTARWPSRRTLADAVAHRRRGRAASRCCAATTASTSAWRPRCTPSPIASRTAICATGCTGSSPSSTICRPSCATGAEHIDEDPERLGEIRERRQLLVDLRRKYGDDLAEVIASTPRPRTASASCSTTTAAPPSSTGAPDDALAAERLQRPSGRSGSRRAAAPRWPRRSRRGCASSRCPTPTSRSRSGPPDDDPGDDVRVPARRQPRLAAAAAARVASGGELARAMLALRLVLAAAGSDRGAVDARVRRGRRRDRRLGGRRGRRGARRARRPPPGAHRHAPAAGGRRRVRPVRREQGGDATPDVHGGHRVAATSGWPRSPGCSAAR